ncbi:uncharacterized protein LOC119180002 isoform X1 [Rhipicephalus microplus]|uniref:uncharacterized protein LOC119180002 isoform X1 n=1 Tax=Rhipicephalus microplus TaxID=6941 RepID=UPI003F6D0E99
MSSYSLRPSSKQRNYREMAQIVDAVVKHRVARLRDRCKPPISEDIYDEILLLMEEKLESGKVTSLLTVSEKARKYWRTHGREFVDLIDLQEHLGRPSKGILLKNGRALLSESLAEELVVQYVAQRGPQTVQRDMQSLFELPLPLIQAHVQRSTNVRLAKDRRYMRLKFEERMSELRQNVLAEATAATAVSPEANGLPLNGQVGTAGGVAVTAPAPADLPVLLIKPMPKRKAKPKSHEQKMRDAVAAARPVVAAQVSPPIMSWEEHPRNLIPELCRQFYDLGWVTGTGGGISIRHGHEIYIAPSGVQKERIAAEDLFVQDMEERFLSGPPPHKKLRKSECTPLFMNAFTLRGAGAVIHTHSKAAVLATLLYPGTEFRITHQEMIKGIKKGQSGISYRYDEELVVPIIENTPFERDLKESMREAMERYPDTCAVLVRRHGVYVWGDSWQRAKTMCECYDYLFDIAVQMKRLGMDPMLPPEPQQNAAAATTLAEAVQVATTGETEAVSVDPPSTLTTLSGELADAPGFMLNLNGPVSTEGQTTYVVYT